MKGHDDVVQVLLAAGASADVRDKAGSTPIDEALRYRHSKVLDLLMAKGGTPAAHIFGRQLADAVLRGHLEMVNLLLSKGADPRVRTASGSTLLHDAALKGYVEIARALLEKGADVNAAGGSGSTPLHDAALGGHAEMVKLLVSNKAQLEVRDTESGATALHRAASWGRTAVLQVLIDAGANPGASDKKGITPLAAAIANGHNEAEALLRQCQSCR
jgi:cytohesin